MCLNPIIKCFAKPELYKHRCTEVWYNKGNLLHILDTDDLCVDTVQYEELLYYVRDLGIDIWNLEYEEENDALKSIYYRFGFYDYDGSTIFGNKLLIGDFGHFITFNGVKIRLGIAGDEDSGFRLVFKDEILHTFNNDVDDGFIGYIFRKGNNLIIKYGVVSKHDKLYCVVYVLDLSGRLIDIWTKDEQYFGKIDFMSKDLAFRTKCIVAKWAY